MILALSGPSSTGKTTLINALYDRRSVLMIATNTSEVILVSETARILYQQHFSDKYDSFEDLLNNDNDAMEFQLLVARDQIDSYYEYNKDKSKLYLCDRCPLDTMVYLSLNYQYASDEVKDKYSSIYLSTMKRLLECYNKSDIVLYRTMPLSSSVESDGFRPMQYVTRRNAELLAFDLMNASAVVLPSDHKDRLELIINDLLASLSVVPNDEPDSKVVEKPNHKYKIIARNLRVDSEGNPDPIKIMYAKSNIDYYAKLFFLKLFYDYIEVEYLVREVVHNKK